MAETDTHSSVASIEDTLLGPDRPDRSSTGLQLARGGQIGRYVVLARLGEGAMGVVYSAFDPELDRKVAVKLLHPRGSDGGDVESARVKLLREAQAMAKLSHPHVVTVHDVGTLGERVWVAMEFVDGKTLSRWLGDGERRWSDVVEAFAQAGRGLAAAHDAGLVHRDFKPDNVMIRDDDRVVVMDFGLARSVAPFAPDTDPSEDGHVPSGEAWRTALTRDGALAGTPAYMAPEQFSGRADARSDQFSFCVSLWEALFGARPFAGTTAAELSLSVTQGELRDPPHRRVPGWIRRVVERGLRPAAQERWPSMGALLAALADDPRRRRRRRAAGAATVVVVAALVAAQMVRGQRAEAECSRAGDEIDELWNEGAEGELRGHLLATGAAHAATSADKVVPRIAAHADAWRDARTRVCRSSRIERAWTDETERRAIACLEENRAAVSTLLAVFAGEGRQAVNHAIDATSSLPSVSACVDEHRLASTVDAPVDDATAARIDSLRLELAELAVLADLDPKRATDRAALILGETRALGWLRGEARAGLLVGAHGTVDGGFEASRKTLQDAFAASSRVGDEELAADIAIQLIATETAAARFDDALLWDRLAAAHIERSGGVGGVREAKRFNTLARLRDQMGEYPEAKALYERMHAIVEAVHGAEHPAVVPALEGLATVEMHAGEIAPSLSNLQRALAIAENAYGPDHPRVGRILASIGSTNFVGGSYDDAAKWYERALGLALRNELDAISIAQLLGNLGNVRFRQRDLPGARGYYDQARGRLESALGPEHPDIARLMTNIAATYADDVSAAIPWLERALAIAERSLGPEHPDLVVLLNNLGNKERGKPDIERALQLHRRALAIAERKLPANHLETMRVLFNMGSDFEKLGDEAAAAEHYGRALSGWSESLGPDHPDTAGAAFAIARVTWRRDGPAARALAERAAAALRRSDSSTSATLAEVEAWLAAHR